MSDVGLNYPVQQPEVSIGEAMSSLTSDLQQAPNQTPPKPLVANALPHQPAQVYQPSELTQDWKDPYQAAMAAGFVQVYANQMPGGLTQAGQHLATFKQAMDQGLIRDEGDDKETHRLWNKFKSNPGALKPDESAALAERLRQVGNATTDSHDLRFDPVGRPVKVSGSGAISVRYPPRAESAALDLRALGGPGLDNLRRLASIGASDAPRPASPGDALAGYLGLSPSQRPSETQLGDLHQALGALAQEQGTSPEAVAGAVLAGWRKIAVRNKPWEKQFALATDSTGYNQAAEALDGRLSARLIDGLRNVAGVDFTAPGNDLSVTVNPDGTTAVSAKPTDSNIKKLRHLYPAAEKNGTTVWLPSQPAFHKDVTRLSGDSVTFNGPTMDTIGGHPAFTAGEHIMFDAPAGFKSNYYAARLGQAISSGLEYQMDRLGSADIDPKKFNTSDSPLLTHAWALVPGANNVRVAATRQGFKPIEHTIGDEKKLLIFGITPSQARKLASAGEIVTNKGTWTDEGFRAGSGVSFDRADDGLESTTHLVSGGVHWFLDGVDRTGGPDDPSDGDIHSMGRRADVRAISLTPEQAANMEQVVGDLKSNGAQNLKVYGHRTFLSGFKSAYEHVYTDGLNYGSQLSSGHSIASHSAHVWVPETTSLPGPVDQQTIPEPPPIQLEGISGLQPVKPNLLDRQVALTIDGSKTPMLKRTQPRQDWTDRFGIEFDPAWRSERGVQTIDPKAQSALQDIYDKFQQQHADAAKLWGLSRIVATTGYSKAPAYTEWGRLGGSIGLSAKHWGDIDQLAKTANEYTQHKIMAGQGVGAFLAHELGHVVGGALQFGSDGSGAKAELQRLRRRAGQAGIAQGISKTAWVSPEEMVAESVSAGLTGNPSPLARDVLNIISNAYGYVNNARVKVNW